MVQRNALRIHHPPQQAIPHGQAQHAFGQHRHFGLAQLQRRHIGLGRRHGGTAGQTLDIARRHQKSALAGKADHLGQHRLLPGHLHMALRAHGHAQARSLQHHAGQAGQGPGFQRHGC
jgi:hypothetical protein